MSDDLKRTALPEKLRAQLADFRRKLWRVKVLEALAAGCIGLLVSFLLVYGIDRLLPTPGWARLLVLLGGLSMFAVFAPYWLHRWVWRRRSEGEIARLIARRFPGLGDRLLGVIELEGQTAGAEALSPRLREAAMDAVAAETAGRDLAGALPPQKHRVWSLVALLCFAGAAVLMVATPQAARNALVRWLLPLAGTERYTFAKLENPPRKLYVPFGEAFDVRLRLAGGSEAHPRSGTGRYGDQPEVSAMLAEGNYSFTFPGQQERGVIEFRIGDLIHRTEIEPLVRPVVEEMRAVITPPEYFGGAPREEDLRTGSVSAVEGGTVEIVLGLNRAIRSATFGPVRTADGKTEPAGNPQWDGAVVTGPPLAVGDGVLEVPVSWTDEFGLGGEPGFSVRIDGRKDAPPSCYLQGTERQIAILPEETIDFEVLSEDDFGLAASGFEWKGEDGRPGAVKSAAGELELARGGADERSLLRPGSFSPVAFGVEPQKILLRGYAEDRFPKRGRVFSEPVTIYVLTRDEHAQLVKNRFDREITGLEDLARREQGLLDENERLGRLEGAELMAEENRGRVRKQQDEEAETSRRLGEAAEALEKLFKDAARNEEIDKETLKKMSGSMETLLGLSKEEIPQLREHLEAAADEAAEASRAAKEMDGAVEQQTKALEKLRQAIKQASDANETMEAGTFANRLKKAAADEKAIVSSVVSAFNRLLGLEIPRVDPSDVRRLGEAAKQQAVIGSDVRWIQEDLAHFIARTKAEGFEEVRKEMNDSGIDTGLEEIRAKLGENKSFEAAEAAERWAGKLAAWAGKIGEAGKNSGGAGGGGSPDAEDEDFEFMLRVMKMVQKELDLRARTRSLEQMLRDSRRSPGR